jgi:UDP-N-acetylglucosamine:LPS N-acetylglucosamine transferase
MNMKPVTKTVFLCTDGGGHKTELQSLLLYMHSHEASRHIRFIGICEGNGSIENIKNYCFFSLRSKYHAGLSLLLLPFTALYNFFKIAFLILRYNPAALISTGPGVVIVPALLFKLLLKKIIYLETNSRFSTRSLTGKVMTYLASRFYIQNADLQVIYPNAIFAGQL